MDTTIVAEYNRLGAQIGLDQWRQLQAEGTEGGPDFRLPLSMRRGEILDLLEGVAIPAFSADNVPFGFEQMAKNEGKPIDEIVAKIQKTLNEKGSKIIVQPPYILEDGTTGGPVEIILQAIKRIDEERSLARDRRLVGYFYKQYSPEELSSLLSRGLKGCTENDMEQFIAYFA